MLRGREACIPRSMRFECRSEGIRFRQLLGMRNVSSFSDVKGGAHLALMSHGRKWDTLDSWSFYFGASLNTCRTCIRRSAREKTYVIMESAVSFVRCWLLRGLQSYSLSFLEKSKLKLEIPRFKRLLNCLRLRAIQCSIDADSYSRTMIVACLKHPRASRLT